jgi:hypothetical protein
MIMKSVAQSTFDGYESVKAESHWTMFLESDDSGDRVKANNIFLAGVLERDKQESLCLFIYHLDKCLNKTRNTIGTIMAALRFLFIINLVDIDFFESPGVRSVRKSLIDRGRCTGRLPVKGTTLFLTLEMLEWLRYQYFRNGRPIELKFFMICISIHLGFHFGYRVGEIAISNGNDEHTILNKDVLFENNKGDFIYAVDAKHHLLSTICVCIVILGSRKANQTGGGDPYFICRYTAASIQLLEDMFFWAQNSATDPNQIFFFRPLGKSGYKLRNHEVSVMIKSAAKHFDLDPTRFASRSMRVSAASHLNAQQLPKEVCKSVTGHSSTSSFDIYVRGTVKDLGVLDLEVTAQLSIQDIKRASLSSRR